MKKICVIFGGKSCEHDVSIITGMQLAKTYNRGIEKIYLGLDNKFYLATKITSLKSFENKKNINLKEVFFSQSAVYLKGVINKKLFDVGCVINCCHGGVGENGDLKAFFNLNKIKCSSTSVVSAHITMDKTLTKKIVSDIAKTVKGLQVFKHDFDVKCEQIDSSFSNNLIVKPNGLGSSIGVKVCDKNNYRQQIKAIFEMNDSALVEERVVDIVEYNQACMLDDDKLLLSAIEQPTKKSDFLSFEDKYNSQSKGKGRDRIIPANIPIKLEQEISKLTRKIYEHLNLEGVVRIDYIYDKKSKLLYFNEVNTVPGSMAFYLYEAVGIDYLTLINKLIENTKECSDYAYFETDVLKNKEV